MELDLELLRARASVSSEPGGLTECLWTGIVAQKPHKLLLAWGPECTRQWHSSVPMSRAGQAVPAADPCRCYWKQPIPS